MTEPTQPFVRKEFSFKTSGNKFNKILMDIAHANININALIYELTKKNKYEVHLIVGLLNDTSSDKLFNARVITILDKYNVKYSINKAVIANAIAGVPGTASKYFTALYESVVLLRNYTGENNIFVFVGCPYQKVLEIVAEVYNSQ